MKLNIRALALTWGILWGLGIFLATLWIILFDGATGEVTILGRIYRGYNISIVGSLFGLLWGFIDGLICGAIFAWVYNLFAGCRTAVVN
jgi:hypothetical protein